jgi:DNA (cytosine-5)-methyltransferase 1
MQPVPSTGDVSHCLNAGGMGRQDYETETLIAHSLRAEGFDASEDGTGRGTPLVPVAFAHQQGGNIDLHTSRDMALALQRSQTQAVCFTAKDHGGDASDISPTLRAGGHSGSHANAGVMPAVVMPLNTQIATRGNALGERTGFGIGADGDPGFTLQAGHSHGIATNSAVRRLTPRECERLQGFPDDYTLIPYRGKPAADGPRYKALGNSMAVPVMRWIGQRIAMVEAIRAERLAA